MQSKHKELHDERDSEHNSHPRCTARLKNNDNKMLSGLRTEKAPGCVKAMQNTPPMQESSMNE